LEFQDNEIARELHANGAYLPMARRDGEPSFSAQDYFMAAATNRARLPD
jgi:polyphosphate kinase